MFPLELKSTSDGCDSLRGMWVRVIQTLIPEGSGPLVVLSELACYSLPLWRRKWQPTPVFLPGESQGWQNLVGCRLWGGTEPDTTEAT